MRRILNLSVLLVTGFIYSGGAAQVQWHILRDVKIDTLIFDYSSISASDDHNFIASGVIDDGHEYHIALFRTTDAGLTWATEDAGLSPELDLRWRRLRKVLMIDSLHIISIGDSGLIIRSSDGGASWIRQDYATPGRLADIHFSDTKTGIIVGGGGTVLTTSDGGVTWHAAQNFPFQAITSCHSYGNARFRAFQYGNGPIYTTSDNWNTWDTDSLFSYSDTTNLGKTIFACHFLGADSILAYGFKVTSSDDTSWVTISTDGGKTWKDKLNRITYVTRGVVAMSTVNNSLWVGGGFGQGILWSTDRGNTWSDDSAIIGPPGGTFRKLTEVQALSPSRAIGVLESITQGYIVDMNTSTLAVQRYERQV